MSPSGEFCIAMQIVMFSRLYMKIVGEVVPGEPSCLGDFFQLLKMTRIEFNIFGPSNRSDGHRRRPRKDRQLTCQYRSSFQQDP